MKEDKRQIVSQQVTGHLQATYRGTNSKRVQHFFPPSQDKILKQEHLKQSSPVIASIFF